MVTCTFLLLFVFAFVLVFAFVKEENNPNLKLKRGVQFARPWSHLHFSAQTLKYFTKQRHPPLLTVFARKDNILLPEKNTSLNLNNFI